MQIHIAEIRREISLPDSRAIRGDCTNSIKRYEENGIKGLETRPVQGRKPIMDNSYLCFNVYIYKI